MNTNSIVTNRKFQFACLAGFGVLSFLAFKAFSKASGVHETEVERDKNQIREEPDSIINGKSQPGIQAAEEGEGPYFHRTYRLHIANPKMDSKSLMNLVRENLNTCSPTLIAEFEKTHSRSGDLASPFAVGDEFQIHISGPWDGPVRVSECKKDSFTFVTKDGHFEAGGICFRVKEANPISTSRLNSVENPSGGPDLIFEIESWSRSRDGLVDLVYDKIPAARVAQTQMWANFCENAAKLSGGIPEGKVEVHTEKAKS